MKQAVVVYVTALFIFVLGVLTGGKLEMNRQAELAKERSGSLLVLKEQPTTPTALPTMPVPKAGSGVLMACCAKWKVGEGWYCPEQTQ